MGALYVVVKESMTNTQNLVKIRRNHKCDKIENFQISTGVLRFALSLLYLARNKNFTEVMQYGLKPDHRIGFVKAFHKIQAICAGLLSKGIHNRESKFLLMDLMRPHGVSVAEN